MDEFECSEPQALLIETKPELLPILQEIKQVGFCKEIYERGESMHPGLFKTIDPKMLTTQHSDVKRLVAMESFGMDDTTSNLVAGGLGVAAAGVLAMGIYKLYKWITGLLSSESDDPEVGEGAAETAKKADAAIAAAADKADKEDTDDGYIKPTQETKGFSIKTYLRGKSGKVKIVAQQVYRYIGGNGMDEKEIKEIIDLVCKSPITERSPATAILLGYQGGMPMLLGVLKQYGIDNALLAEAHVYSQAFYEASEAMFDYSMSPDSGNFDKLKKSIASLKQHGALKPALGKLITAMENGNLPTGEKKVCWKKGPGVLPDHHEAKPTIDFLESGGVQHVILTVMPQLSSLVKLPHQYLDASGKVSDKLDVETARKASEKIKDERLADNVREIHKGLVRATKLRNLCRQINKILAKAAACDADIVAVLDKYNGKK